MIRQREERGTRDESSGGDYFFLERHCCEFFVFFQTLLYASQLLLRVEKRQSSEVQRVGSRTD